MRKEIIDLGNGYMIRIYDNDVILLEQDVDIDTGQPITDASRAEEIATILLQDYQRTDKSLIQTKIEELSKLTYQFIAARYPREKQDSDIVDSNFWPIFLVEKKDYTMEEIAKKIYDYTGQIIDGSKNFEEISSKLLETYTDDLSFGIEPFDREINTFNVESYVFENLGQIVPKSVKGRIDYGGQIKTFKEDGSGILLDETDNEYGRVNYDQGIITLPEGIDLNFINELNIKYRRYLIIPESNVWIQILKTSLRVAFVENIKFRYKFLKQMIMNMNLLELRNLDVDKLINDYYPDINLDF